MLPLQYIRVILVQLGRSFGVHGLHYRWVGVSEYMGSLVLSGRVQESLQYSKFAGGTPMRIVMLCMFLKRTCHEGGKF